MHRWFVVLAAIAVLAVAALSTLPASSSRADDSTDAGVAGSGTDTAIWGDNDCSGIINVQDVLRNFIALLFPDRVEDIAGCPDMGATIVVPEPTPEPDQVQIQGGGPVIWGDVHCTEQIDETDPMAVLYYIAGLPDLGHSGYCPEVGSAITFTQ
jgi:hypothetical protein